MKQVIITTCYLFLVTLICPVNCQQNMSILRQRRKIIEVVAPNAQQVEHRSMYEDIEQRPIRKRNAVDMVEMDTLQTNLIHTKEKMTGGLELERYLEDLLEFDMSLSFSFSMSMSVP